MEIPEPKFTLNQIVYLKSNPTRFFEIEELNYSFYGQGWFCTCHLLNKAEFSEHLERLSEDQLQELSPQKAGPKFYTKKA